MDNGRKPKRSGRADATPPPRSSPWLARTTEPNHERRTDRLDRLAGALPAHLRRGPWWVVSASLLGLVLAIAVAGLVALAFNRTVQQETEGALRYDIALQDDSDDLRVAILDVRHHHRNLIFYGPSNDQLIEFDDAYADLLEEIVDVEEVGALPPRLTQPQELRQMANEYYEGFRPALDLYSTDPAAFEVSSNEGLLRLAVQEREARQIDGYAESQADVAVARIEQASANARLVLLVVIGGLVLIGAALIYAAGRVFSEVRRLYEAEQAASQRLGEALQAQTDFVADISHELRTPLTVVRGNAEAGLAIDAGCQHQEFLEEIVGESVRMTRLVEDLLFLARSDAATPPLDIEPVAVGNLLEAVAERSRALVGQRDATLSTSLTAEGTIVVDASRIEQAVLVLIDNAAKFSPPGGKVYLSSSTLMGDLIVEVADEGLGIPEAELPLIFERYYRRDRLAGRRRGGTGLGLSIARTIVEAHGGRIDAQSSLGNGTRMRIHLPLAGAVSRTPAAALPGKSAELGVGPAVT